MANRMYRQGDDIRLSQIIGAHGVGGLRIQMGGLSMICAGLDHWYQNYTSTRPMLDIPFDRKDVIIKEKGFKNFLMLIILCNHRSIEMIQKQRMHTYRFLISDSH